VPTTLALLILEGQATPRPADVANLSRGGVSLRVDERVELSKTVALALQAPRGGFRWRGRARVIYIVNQRNGRHLLGCQFLHELSDEELRRLL
jgi:hypothetical protein